MAAEFVWTHDHSFEDPSWKIEPHWYVGGADSVHVDSEVTPDNTLLAFTGIQYIQNSVSPPCSLTSTSLSVCAGLAPVVSTPITLWETTDPVVCG
jgi:hypothetical protein